MSPKACGTIFHDPELSRKPYMCWILTCSKKLSPLIDTFFHQNSISSIIASQRNQPEVQEKSLREDTCFFVMLDTGILRVLSSFGDVPQMSCKAWRCPMSTGTCLRIWFHPSGGVWRCLNSFGDSRITEDQVNAQISAGQIWDEPDLSRRLTCFVFRALTQNWAHWSIHFSTENTSPIS